MAQAMHANLVTHVGGEQGAAERRKLFSVRLWADELGLVLSSSLEATCLQVWLEGQEAALLELERRCCGAGVNLLKVPDSEEF